MRYMFIVSALTFALYAGVCEAEDNKEKGGVPSQTVVVEKTKGSGLKRIEVPGPDRATDEPVDRMGVMAPGRTYDQNTGLPNTVPSDAVGDLE